MRLVVVTDRVSWQFSLPLSSRKWATAETVNFAEVIDEVLSIRFIHERWLIDEEDKFGRIRLHLRHVVDPNRLPFKSGGWYFWRHPSMNLLSPPS